MEPSKSKKNSRGNSLGEMQQFFIWHGEKILVCVVVVLALWFALKGLDYTSLPWQPSELETIADGARRTIESSTFTSEDVGAKQLDYYSTLAEQIRLPIRAEYYRNVSQWHPPFGTSPPPLQQRSPSTQNAPTVPGGE